MHLVGLVWFVVRRETVKNYHRKNILPLAVDLFLSNKNKIQSKLIIQMLIDGHFSGNQTENQQSDAAKPKKAPLIVKRKKH